MVAKGRFVIVAPGSFLFSSSPFLFLVLTNLYQKQWRKLTKLDLKNYQPSQFFFRHGDMMSPGLVSLSLPFSPSLRSVEIQVSTFPVIIFFNFLLLCFYPFPLTVTCIGRINIGWVHKPHQSRLGLPLSFVSFSLSVLFFDFAFQVFFLFF